jgi:3-dehydro-glucose-6-phosphate--glutamate transaminase
MMRPEEKLACAQAMAECVRDGTCLYGPEGEVLAASLAEFLGVAHVIPCASGTAALTVALLALGVGEGDEVIIPANSFAATENAVLAVGAMPVLADVRATDHNLDPDAAEAAVTSRARAILPVDLHGAPAPMEELRDIASRRGLALIEDACQAIGSDGVGRHADLAALSFNAFKNFSACGKAGAVLARDPDLARKAAMCAYHGFEPGQKMVKRFDQGLNAPMDNIQAAALLARLPHLTLVGLRRVVLAMRYSRALSPLERAGLLRLPHDRPDHAWHLYTVTLPGPGERQALMDHLAARGLPSKIVYPALSHRQDNPLARRVFAKARLPVTERLHELKLCLPLFNGMALAEQDRVIGAVLEFHGMA